MAMLSKQKTSQKNKDGGENPTNNNTNKQRQKGGYGGANITYQLIAYQRC